MNYLNALVGLFLVSSLSACGAGAQPDACDRTSVLHNQSSAACQSCQQRSCAAQHQALLSVACALPLVTSGLSCGTGALGGADGGTSGGGDSEAACRCVRSQLTGDCRAAFENLGNCTADHCANECM